MFYWHESEGWGHLAAVPRFQIIVGWWIGFCPTRQPSTSPIVCFHQSKQVPAHNEHFRSITNKRISEMRLTNKIKEAGATGYILLWLLGIPIPILLLIFLLRGCT